MMLEATTEATLVLVPVPFPETGDTLFAAASGDPAELVALKPICEALGLDWSSQHHRLQRHEVLATSMVNLTIETVAGPRKATCLPLDLVPGFLFGISINSCRVEIRPKVKAFQAHCFRVLRDHFRPQRADKPLPLAGPSDEFEIEEDLLGDDSASVPDRTNALWLSLVRETRILRGREAACAMWARSPLPPLPPRATARVENGGDVENFLNDCCTQGSGLRVRANLLYSAYKRWAHDHPQPMSSVTFGKAMSAAGFRRLKTSGATVYLGLTERRAI